MSSSVIAMLAAQTAEYYNSTHNAMNSSNLKNNLDKVRFQPIVNNQTDFPNSHGQGKPKLRARTSMQWPTIMQQLVYTPRISMVRKSQGCKWL